MVIGGAVIQGGISERTKGRLGFSMSIDLKQGLSAHLERVFRRLEDLLALVG